MDKKENFVSHPYGFVYVTTNLINGKRYVGQKKISNRRYDYYKKYHTEDEVNDEWYEENVIKMEKFIITDELGCISQSGYGDGCYSVYAEYKGKNAFAIRIKFI